MHTLHLPMLTTQVVDNLDVVEITAGRTWVLVESLPKKPGEDMSRRYHRLSR